MFLKALDLAGRTCLAPGIGLLLAVSAAAPSEAREVALIIGNSDYRGTPAVEEAGADARKLARALRARGAEIVQGYDLSSEELGRTLSVFEKSIRPGDEVTLYFSGLSTYFDGTNHLAPVDFAAGGNTADRQKLFGVNAIVARLKNRAAKLVALIDACREIDLFGSSAEAISGECGNEAAQPGTSIVLAAEPGKLVKNSSLLAGAYIETAIEGATPLPQALEAIRKQVEERTNGEQVIAFFTADGGNDIVQENPEIQPEDTPEIQPEDNPEITENNDTPEVNGTESGARDCAECPELVAIPAGQFEMGSSKGGRSEVPVHSVDVGAFLIGKYELTIGEWRACVATEACRDLGKAQAENSDDLPAFNLTWADAQAYLGWLSQKTGKTYRLPSEAEWEYAARANTPSAYSGSNTPDPAFMHCKTCGDTKHTKAPSSKDLQPNAFGVVGMSGGIAEWVADCWKPNYEGHPGNAAPIETANCSKRVLRGGSWRDGEKQITVSARASYDFDVPYPNNGFRVAREP